MTTTAPRPPAGIDEAGKRLWKKITATYDLEPGELEQLVGACLLEDLADRLGAVIRAEGVLAAGSTGQVVAHPAVGELRRTIVERDKVIRNLAIPTENDRERFTPRQRAGRKAAQARWEPAGRPDLRSVDGGA